MFTEEFFSEIKKNNENNNKSPKSKNIYTAETSFMTNQKSYFFYTVLTNNLKYKNQKQKQDEEEEVAKIIMEYENLLKDKYNKYESNIYNEIESLIKEKYARDYNREMISERKNQIEMKRNLDNIKLQIKHKYNEMNAELINIKNNALKNIILNNRNKQKYK